MDGNLSNQQVAQLGRISQQRQAQMLGAGATMMQQSAPQYPGIIGYEYVSIVSGALTNAGDNFRTAFKNPNDTNVLAVITFDPSLDVSINVKIDSSKKNVLDNYGCKIGNVGVVYLKTYIKQFDRIDFQVNLLVTPAAAITPIFNFGFLFDPGAPV